LIAQERQCRHRLTSHHTLYRLLLDAFGWAGYPWAGSWWASTATRTVSWHDSPAPRRGM
jgi:hypothetical protein